MRPAGELAIHDASSLAPRQRGDVAIDAPHGGEEAGANLIEVCWRRRATVLAVAAASVAMGVGYLHVAPRTYTSTAKVLVQQNGPRLLTADVDAASGRSDGYLYQQVEIIRAEPILARAVEGCPIEAIELFPQSADRARDLRDRLWVGVGKRDEVISVRLESEHPKAAARLVNAVVEAYEAFQSGHVRSSAAEVLGVLRREKDKQDEALGRKLAEIVAFKQANAEQFFTDERGQNILVQNLAMISDQAMRARLYADGLRASAARQSNRQRAEQEAARLDLELRIARGEVPGSNGTSASAPARSEQEEDERPVGPQRRG